MFAQRKLCFNAITPFLILGPNERLPLFHQHLPQLFCLLQSDWKVIYEVHDVIENLVWKLLESFHRPELLSPPLSLLTRYICCRNNFDIRINEEESEKFSVSRLRVIRKGERLKSMLKEVRECNKTTFFRNYIADILYGCLAILAPKDFF